jgi:CubicO group peptidase (beta-lactamase class C family)
MRFRPLLIVSLALSASLSHAADHKNLIDDMVRPLVEEKFVVACVVGVVDHGQREVYGYGVTRLGGSDEPKGDTVFEIGSMTKAITGTLLADMANRGLVNLDAPLQDFMPEGLTLHEVEGHPIRLVDVASQSSGLPRMPTNFAPKDPKNPYVDYTVDDMFSFLRGYQLTRPPGEYEYSNFGMGLLGYVVAKQAGKSYESLLAERICDPLKMKDTRITLTDEQRRRLAAPYNGELAPDCNWELGALAGAGAIHSTVNDMLKLLDASLCDDDRAVVAALHEAWKQHYGPPATKSENDLETSWSHGLPTEHRVGLGWQIAPDGVTRWHNGQTGGYSAVMYVHPPTKQGVVILCNTPTDLIWPLGEKLLQSMRGLKPARLDVPRAIALSPHELRRYEGVYQLNESESIDIALDHDGLSVQMTGQERHRLYPRTETDFFVKIADAQITFETGDDGEVKKLTLHQDNVDQSATRVAP